MTVTIEITRRDIDEGVKVDCENCPISKAILRSLPQVKRVFTTRYYSIVMTASGTRYRLDSPNIYRFIEAFDFDPAECHPCLIEAAVTRLD